jgi:hypothetical protein
VLDRSCRLVSLREARVAKVGGGWARSWSLSGSAKSLRVNTAGMVGLSLFSVGMGLPRTGMRLARIPATSW